jgi:hypothetical protein
VFRWPLALTPFSLLGRGVPREATLEITPRAAAFTLAALSHVGHAAHLALVDAYLKGQIRLTETAEIGQDSRTVAASLATPLVAAAELGVERLTLADVILLPRDPRANADAERSASGQPTRSPDCARFLLRAHGCWHWIRGAERFERPGCLGTRHVAIAGPWHEVMAELPDSPQVAASARAGHWPAPIAAEARAPTMPTVTPDTGVVSAARALALGRFGRAPTLIQRAADELAARVGTPGAGLLDPADLRAERAQAARQPARRCRSAADAADLAGLLAEPIEQRRPAATSIAWHSVQIDVALAPDLDGYSTLCLLPPADAAPATIVPLMLDATRSIIEALIGRPLAEHRSDPIAITLCQDRGGPEQATTLEIGESIIIVRNQVVFTAWVGSDGRAMLKLFPPGGMR